MNRYCELIQVTPLQEEVHAAFDPDNEHHQDATIGRTFNYEPHVTSAAETVNGLRYAPMNSAYHKTVRFVVDCLPRCGFRVDKSS